MQIAGQWQRQIEDVLHMHTSSTHAGPVMSASAFAFCLVLYISYQVLEVMHMRGVQGKCRERVHEQGELLLVPNTPA